MDISFDFIKNDKFRSILIRDARELSICLSSEAYKSAIVMAGSIVEAILIDYFLHYPPPNLTKDSIEKLTLDQLIQYAAPPSQFIKDCGTRCYFSKNRKIVSRFEAL